MLSATLQIIGLLGALLYLASYAAVQTGRLDGNGSLYALANTAAAALVLTSLFESYNPACAIIQVTWLIIGLARLLRPAISADICEPLESK